MAEAITMLGAASSILQTVDFPCKLISHTRELNSANNDALSENIEIERLVRSLSKAGTNLAHAIPDASKRTTEQQDSTQITCLRRLDAKELLNKLQDQEAMLLTMAGRE
ncbi:hypothetical protein DOTSEDRAFT_29245 [Dothistroma septosporum NZE10]|uniref:Uncharacterized protein n=1 Tax=Dothistroma septosporum (strain NZE10 / CBS 128990) TaxID=675120 RepID=M2YJH5_DOTSN|nr:hypothetical protein DOTSEDRAFT_29245 [Dothistroma septosporum NZE10]